MNDLEKVFLSSLKGIYDGEFQIVDALPKMEKSAQSQELKDAFRLHLDQSRTHISRLEEVFRGIGQSADRKTCKGIAGIIDDGELMAAEFEDNSGLDAALILGAQQVEHFEIACYGTLCSWAEELGYDSVLPLLKENLTEERQTDEKLTELAETARNVEATHHDMEKHGEFASKVSTMVGVK